LNSRGAVDQGVAFLAHFGKIRRKERRGLHLLLILLPLTFQSPSFPG
jgi:hypothetical protein